MIHRSFHKEEWEDRTFNDIPADLRYTSDVIQVMMGENYLLYRSVVILENCLEVW